MWLRHGCVRSSFTARIMHLQRFTVSIKEDHLNENAFHSIKCYESKGIILKYVLLTQLHTSWSGLLSLPK